MKESTRRKIARGTRLICDGVARSAGGNYHVLSREKGYLIYETPDSHFNLTVMLDSDGCHYQINHKLCNLLVKKGTKKEKTPNALDVPFLGKAVAELIVKSVHAGVVSQLELETDRGVITIQTRFEEGAEIQGDGVQEVSDEGVH